MATLGFEDYINPLKAYLARYREVITQVVGCQDYHITSLVMWLRGKDSLTWLIYVFFTFYYYYYYFGLAFSVYIFALTRNWLFKFNSIDLLHLDWMCLEIKLLQLEVSEFYCSCLSWLLIHSSSIYCLPKLPFC